MRQFICDHCGRIVSEEKEISNVQLEYREDENSETEIFFDGDLCDECYSLLRGYKDVAVANAMWLFSIDMPMPKKEWRDEKELGF